MPFFHPTPQLLYTCNSSLTDPSSRCKTAESADCSWPSWPWCCRASVATSSLLSCREAAPVDISTIDRAVAEDSRATSVSPSGVVIAVAAVVTSASVITEEDPARLTERRLAAAVAVRSVDSRPTDTRNSATAAAVDTRTAAPGAIKGEDSATADATAAG